MWSCKGALGRIGEQAEHHKLIIHSIVIYEAIIRWLDMLERQSINQLDEVQINACTSFIGAMSTVPTRVLETLLDCHLYTSVLNSLQ